MINIRSQAKGKYGGNGEEVEHGGAVLPDVGVAVLLLALVVEAIDLGNLTRFVVSTKQGHLLGPP